MGIADLNWQGALKNLPLAIAAVRPDGGGMEAMQMLERRREQEAMLAGRQQAAEAKWAAQQQAAELAEARKRDLTGRLVAFGRDVYGGQTPPTEQSAMEAMHRYGIDPMIGVKFMGEWAKYRQTQARERRENAVIAKMKSIGGGGGGAGKAYKPVLFRTPDGNYTWITPGQDPPKGVAPYHGGAGRTAEPMSDPAVEKVFAEMSVGDKDIDVEKMRKTYWQRRAMGATPEQAYMSIVTAMPAGPEDPFAPMNAQAQSMIAEGGYGGIAPPAAEEEAEPDEGAQWATFLEEVRRTLAEPDPEE